MGLVNRVLPDAELDDYVRKIALELAANAPLTIAAFTDREREGQANTL